MNSFKPGDVVTFNEDWYIFTGIINNISSTGVCEVYWPHLGVSFRYPEYVLVLIEEDLLYEDEVL